MTKASMNTALKSKAKPKKSKLVKLPEKSGSTVKRQAKMVKPTGTGEQEINTGNLEHESNKGSKENATPGCNKKVSEKLLKSIDRHKASQAKSASSNFGKIPRRRGRRPKAAVEYVPGNQDEQSYVLESDFEGLEYDTGIRVKESRDDHGTSLDRLEDFDEELNFDW